MTTYLKWALNVVSSSYYLSPIILSRCHFILVFSPQTFVDPFWPSLSDVGLLSTSLRALWNDQKRTSTDSHHQTYPPASTCTHILRLPMWYCWWIIQPAFYLHTRSHLFTLTPGITPPILLFLLLSFICSCFVLYHFISIH